ncbi:hypothetical protein [Pseudohongiella acticola]|uniref:hypothetical protein n=1 Tax=Pseudohongiella acticola TaxID=1524254 RepID=UPI00111313EE|nr:hypothetical protein [Pseudohongiella acticola]
MSTEDPQSDGCVRRDYGGHVRGDRGRDDRVESQGPRVHAVHHDLPDEKRTPTGDHRQEGGHPEPLRTAESG